MGLGAGAATAVMVGRWARRQADRYAPPHLAKQASETLGDLGSLLAEAFAEFRKGMAEKEAEVRASLKV
jgi:hypothetical protein